METESTSKNCSLDYRVLGNDANFRCQHTSTLIGMNIITIGGTGRDSAGEMTYFTDVVSFNLPNKAVERVQVEGDSWVARKGHTACLYGRNEIVIFGGSNSEGVKKDIGILTFSDSDGYKAKWERKGLAGTAIYRANHTACVYADKLYVFGGKDQHEKLPKYTFWCLNLSSINPSEWGVLDMIGQMPSKRWGHSSTIMNDQMIIYGGHDDKQFLNDLWIYNFGNSLWSQVTRAKGLIPAGRRGATVDYMDGKLYIFGGALALTGHCDELYSFDIEDNNWEKLSVNNSGLAARSYHTCVCLNGSLIFWGGQSMATYIKNISTIEFGSGSEEKLGENSLVLQGKYNAYFDQMRRFYTEKLFADIVFVVQGEEIPAHKGIIAARSRFFENIFLSGMMESQSQKIEITDMKADTFKAMLGYLYLNEVELTRSRATELLEISDKYVIGELKTLCGQYLSQIISLNNFIHLAEISERFDATLLQESIVNFAISHLDQINSTVSDEILNLSKRMLWQIALKINQSVKSQNNKSNHNPFFN